MMIPPQNSPRRRASYSNALPLRAGVAALVAAMLASVGSVQAAGTVIYKANNTTDLNASGSFVTTSGGTTVATPPTTGTGSYTGATGSTTANTAALILEWDSTVPVANTVRTGGGTGATFAVDGIIIANPGGLVTINQNAGTTTVGLSGIDMSNATQDLTIAGGTVRVGPGVNTGINETWTVASGRTLTINSALNGSQGGTNTLTFAGSGNVAINGAISQSGVARMTVNGATVTFNGASNTASGPLTITSGMLNVGNGSTTGFLGSGVVTNNAVLNFNRSDTLTVANVISGSGTVNQVGAGMLTFSAANTYTGGTAITGGSITAAINGALGTGNVTLANGVTLTLATGVTDAIADTATLTLGTGAGANATLALNGTNGTAQETVNGLIVNGTPLAPGKYGSASDTSVTAAFRLPQITGTGELNVLTLAAIPEPSTWAMLLSGLGGLGVMMMRRKRCA